MEWQNIFQDLHIHLENYASLTSIRNGKNVISLKIHLDLFYLIYRLRAIIINIIHGI